MSETPWRAGVPLVKGRPGQLAFMRVRIIDGGARPESITISPVNAQGQPCKDYEHVEYDVNAEAILTMQEARRAAQGNA